MKHRLLFTSLFAALVLGFTLQVQAETKATPGFQFFNKPTPAYESQWGVGISSSENLVGVGPAISALWVSADEGTTIQGIAGVENTKPFQFGLGAVYRQTVTGTSAAGLHWGPALSFGKTRNVNFTPSMFLQVSALGGIHFLIPSMNKIHFSFDAGPMLRFQSGGPYFQLVGIGALVGFSVHYLL